MPSALTLERSLAALMLRVGVGLIFLLAGLEKVVRGPEQTARLFAEMGVPWPEITGPATGYFELLGSLCVLTGALTRPVALLFAVEMLVAIAFVQVPRAVLSASVSDAFAVLRLELLLCLSAMAIALLNGGRWSVDHLVHGDRRDRRQLP